MGVGHFLSWCVMGYIKYSYSKEVLFVMQCLVKIAMIGRYITGKKEDGLVVITIKNISIT